jgi:hypothetical protein
MAGSEVDSTEESIFSISSATATIRGTTRVRRGVGREIYAMRIYLAQALAKSKGFAFSFP